MEVCRTVQVKLRVPANEEPVVRETVERFRACSNRTSEWAWSNHGTCVIDQAKAEQALYSELKDETGLHANLVQKAIRRGIEAVRAGVTRRERNKPTSQPNFTALSAVYDKRSATFYRDQVSLSTLEGRLECDYVLPADDDSPHHRYLLNENYEFRTSTLHFRNGDWYLHAVMRTTELDPVPQAEHRTVLGVDLGVENLAVTSTGRFWKADEFNHWRREYDKRLRSLQRNGTRWAHRNMESVGRRQTGRLCIMLHRISNELIAEAQERRCAVIAFEDLIDIRDRLPGATWHHQWAFHRLITYVEYKGHVKGIEVEQIDPKYTSQQCSTCEFRHPDNRDGRTFECQNCGYENDADYNAAKNIGLRYLRRNQNGADGGAPVGVRLNSGTLNANGEPTPPSDDSRAGVHAESP